jgi:hypothetical protein
MRPLRLLLSLAALMVAARAGAENPRVTLHLERATAPEIIAALSKASGVPISLFGQGEEPGEQAPPVEGLEQKISVDWKAVPLADALRELCKKYPLQPLRSQGGGFTLQPTFEAPLPPMARRVGLAEQQGIRLYALGVNLNLNRTLRFDGGPQEGVNVLVLEVAGEVPGGQAESIAGLANVTARDDLGHVLSPVGEALGRNVYVPGYPDEFRGQVAFNRPHPHAKKLAWVQGDVLVHRTFQPYSIQLPLPIPAAGTRKSAGPFTIEALNYEAAAKLPADQLPEPDFKVGPRVTIRIRARAGTPLPDAEEIWRAAPALIDQTGRLFGPIAMTPGDGNQPDSFELTCVYPAPPSPASHLVLRLVERSEPQKLFTFRMKDIPLPPEELPAPNPAVKPAPSGIPGLPAQSRDTVLLQRVAVGGRPVSGGILSLGLSRKGARGWEAVRWHEVEVGEDGAARLPGIAPGTYRIERRYRPKDGLALPAGGTWNTRAEVVLTRGKEVAAPPFRWEKGSGTGRK